MTQPPAGQGAQPRPTLSLWDAVAIIVGIVIGVGIFKTPSIVAGNAGSEAVFYLLWLAGGVISLVGALCYAELGSAYPNAGGEYYFLTRAFGGHVGFLFAWARMTVIQTGAIAAIAFVFGDYASELVPLGKYSSALYAAVAIAVVTGLNIVGTKQGKWVQNVVTAVLTVSILAVVAAGIMLAPGMPHTAAAADDPWSFSGLAMIFILLTYGGWNEAAYLSAEIRDGRRNIVKALLIGIVTITVFYLLLNFAYVNALGLAGMKESKAVAADLIKVTLGEHGAALLSVMVMTAALSTINATVFTGARTNYALGRDFALFGWLGKWDERAQTPANALLVQGAIALALVVFASFTRDGFSTMVDFTAPVFWMFFLATGISLFVLRRQQPVNSKPFRVPLYPVTPLLFCGMCLYMLYSSLAYTGLGSLLGVGVLAVGVPLLFVARRR